MSQRRWRSGSAKTLFARAIKKIEYPLLIRKMKGDGLHAEITDKGIVWFYGDYKIKRQSICDVWGLTIHQLRMFERHVLETNPFGGYYEGDDYINE